MFVWVEINMLNWNYKFIVKCDTVQGKMRDTGANKNDDDIQKQCANSKKLVKSDTVQG